MKRKLCFLFALTAAVCIFSCAVPAMADDSPYDDFWDDTNNWQYIQDISVFINDSKDWPDGTDIRTEYDPSLDSHTFEYVGNGDLQEWTFPKAVEGRDYEIVSRSNNSITLRFINPTHGIPYVNAVVDFEDLTTQKETKAAGQTQADTTQKAEKVAAETTGSTAAPEETHENSTAPAAEKSETKPDSTGKTAAVAGGVIAGVIVIAGVVIAIKKRH